MEHEIIAGMDLFFASEENEAARIIAAACKRSVPFIRQHWGLKTPKDCRVYVMTSWKQFLFDSAPWLWKAYMTLTFPLVAKKASSIWSYTGGWSLAYGRRKVVGIKPPRLIQKGDRSLGEHIFLPDRDLQEIVQTITCHELVHGFTSHLKLPTWLHEGLATLAMEHYLNRRIVRDDSLERLVGRGFHDHRKETNPQRVDRQQALIAQYAWGYWLTRYLDETQPQLLRDLLARRMRHKNLEAEIASALGKEPESFWQEIDGDLYARYR